MTYYTGKGDDGTTKLFDCPSGKRVSKNSDVIIALGSVDELNSMIGVCRAHAKKVAGCADVQDILYQLQQDLFVAQAQLAGADKKITSDFVGRLNKWVDGFAKELPPIKSFTVTGEHELVAFLDYARTLARRAERNSIAASAERKGLEEAFIPYFNRLSSVLFVCARVAAHRLHLEESSPTY